MDWLDIADEQFWEQGWVVRVLTGPYGPSEKLLFLWLASEAPDGCRMANKTIMRELGCSESAVSKAVKNLRSGGELIVTGNKGSRRRMYLARAPWIKSNQAG